MTFHLIKLPMILVCNKLQYSFMQRSWVIYNNSETSLFFILVILTHLGRGDWEGTLPLWVELVTLYLRKLINAYNHHAAGTSTWQDFSVDSHCVKMTPDKRVAHFELDHTRSRMNLLLQLCLCILDHSNVGTIIAQHDLDHIKALHQIITNDSVIWSPANKALTVLIRIKTWYFLIIYSYLEFWYYFFSYMVDLIHCHCTLSSNLILLFTIIYKIFEIVE